MPQKYVTVDGLAAYLHHVGPTTLPERPPRLERGETVLCLHCTGANGAVFGELFARLEREHSPLAFDQPGHAQSCGLDSLGSIARMSAYTRALATKLGLPRCVLLGSSLGGAVALETALETPELVRGLILVSSGARFEISPETLERTRRITEGKASREFPRGSFSPTATPDVMRRGFMEDLKTDPRTLLGDLRALAEWNREADLGRVSAPTLVAVGEDDSPALRAQAELLAARIPKARLAVIPKAGHRLVLEQPQALADAVLAFLAELPK